MNIHAYHVPSQGGRFLSPHFRVKDFACKNGAPVVFIDIRLVVLLEKLWLMLGCPVQILCAYRDYGYNQFCNGAKNSPHMYGIAADITCKAVPLGDVCAALETLGAPGIGLYPDRFVHVDLRDTPAFWQSTRGRKIKIDTFLS